MFIDSHAHLFFKDFEGDLRDVLARARDAGVTAVVCPGTDRVTSEESIHLAEEHDMIYACVGFHPHDASKATEADYEAIEEMSAHPKVVAIGEIGLDYHYNFSPPEVQRTVFRRHIEIARRRNMPIVIHSREAEADCLAIVKQALDGGDRWKSDGTPRGVFHCFPGDKALADQVLSWQFLISIPGPVTFEIGRAHV
jgi:TatD DNase family protein